MEMKAILIKGFLLMEVVLFWTVILPVAALFALGVVIRERTLWWKTQRSFATGDRAVPTPGRLAVPTAPANRAGSSSLQLPPAGARPTSKFR